MISLMKQLKKQIEETEQLTCEIQSRYEDIYPNVRLEPKQELWQQDNLGNIRSKQIEFNISRYIEKSNYVDNLEEAINFIQNFYKTLREFQIVEIISCRISTDELQEQLLVEAKGNFIIKLYKRRS